MAISNVGAAWASLGLNIREWMRGLSQAEKAWVTFGAKLQVAGFRLGAALTTLFVVPALAVSKVGMSMEKAFAEVRKTVDSTEKTLAGANRQFKELENVLRETAKASTFSFEELSNLARIGGQLGVGIQDLGKFTETISKLSIAAADMPAEEAATGLARVITVTQEAMGDVDIFASVLAKLADQFPTTEARALNFSERLSGLAEVANIGATDLISLGTAFTSFVPGVETVSTQMSKAMAQFAEAVATGGKELKTLDALVAHTGYSFSTLWKVDAANAIVQFLKGLGNISQADAFKALENLHLTNQRAAQAFLTSAGAADKFSQALSEGRKEADLARTSVGKLNSVFEQQMNTVFGQWEALKNKVKDALFEMFKAWEGTIRDFIHAGEGLASYLSGLAEVFKAMPDWLKTAAASFISLQLVIAGGMKAFGMLVSVVTPLLSLFKGAGTVAAAAGAATEGAGAAAGGAATGFSLLGGLITAATVAIILTIAKAASLKKELNELAASPGYRGEGLDELEIKFIRLSAAFEKAQKEVRGFAESKVRTGLAEQAEKTAADLKLKLDDVATAIIRARAEWDKGIQPSDAGAMQKALEGLNAAGSRYVRIMHDAGESWEDARKKWDDLNKGKLDLATAEAEKYRKEVEKLAEKIGKGGLSDEIKKYTDSIREAGGVQNLTKAGLKEVAGIAQQARDSFQELSPEVAEAAKKYQALADAIEIAAEMFEESLEKMKPGPLGAAVFPGQAWGATPGFTETMKGAGPGDFWKQFGAPGGLQPGFSLAEPSKEVKKAEEEFKKLLDRILDSDKALDGLANAFKVMGVSSNSSIMKAIGGLQVMQNAFSKIGAIAKLGKLSDIMGGGKGEGGFFSNLLGGTKETFSAASEAAGGGIMGAISGGLAAAGPWGQAAMAAFSIFKAVFAKKQRWEIIGEESAKLFGKSFSEELSKQIEATEKTGKDFTTALGANIGSIIEEVGITAANFKQMWGHLFVLIDKTKDGTLDFAAANEQATKAFGPMLEYLKTMGIEGELSIGQMVTRMRELGLATAEVDAFMREQGQALVDALGPALEYIGSLTDMTAEQATGLSGVVVAAWAGAVAATGSFIEAVRMLGDEFGAALNKILAVLGPGGETLLGPIVQIYNIIKENQPVFDAMHGIIAGLSSMAQMGILTKESLGAMGEAVRVTFEDILHRTNDLDAALKASWPDLVKLYDYYKKMGLDVPAWLQELIDKGQGMGLSLEIPKSVEESLREVVRLLDLIAQKLGAIPQAANNAANSLNLGGGGGAPPTGYPNEGPGGPNAQMGFRGTIVDPTTLHVAETGPEEVTVRPAGRGGGGGGPMTVILELDGVTLGRVISNMSKDGRVRINSRALKEFVWFVAAFGGFLWQVLSASGVSNVIGC